MDDFEYVDGYLERIDLPLLPSIDPDSLMLLQTNHLRHIPYENLDIMVDNVPLNLDPEYLWDKMVRRKRGGICYEHNILFAEVLERLGFRVRRMAAHDPLMGQSEYEHMFLLVDFPRMEETWLADVGFASNFLAPIKFKVDIWQSDLRDMLRIDHLGHGVYDLVRRNDVGDEEVMYEFNLSSHTNAQYQPRCDWVATNVRSPLRMGPVISMDAVGGRAQLTRDEFVHHVNGHRQSVPITSAQQFYQILKQEFGIEEEFDLGL